MSTAVSIAIRNALVREGVRRILSDSSFRIVETVDNLERLNLPLPSPDSHAILVVDRFLLGTNGANAVAILLRRFPGIRIVALVDSFDFAEMSAIFAAGAYAYFLDHVPYQSLVAMMQMVAVGQKVPPPELIDILGEMLLLTDRSAERRGTTTNYNLSEREHVVLAGLEQGHPNKAIAYQLGISEPAIKATVKSIFRKLGVRNRTQAAVIAREIAVREPIRTSDRDS